MRVCVYAFSHLLIYSFTDLLTSRWLVCYLYIIPENGLAVKEKTWLAISHRPRPERSRRRALVSAQARAVAGQRTQGYSAWGNDAFGRLRGMDADFSLVPRIAYCVPYRMGRSRGRRLPNGSQFALEGLVDDEWQEAMQFGHDLG